MNIEKATISLKTAAVIAVMIVGFAVRFEVYVNHQEASWKRVEKSMWSTGDQHLWEHQFREKNQGKVLIPSTEEIIRSRPSALLYDPPKHGVAFTK